MSWETGEATPAESQEEMSNPHIDTAVPSSGHAMKPSLRSKASLQTVIRQSAI